MRYLMAFVFLLFGPAAHAQIPSALPVLNDPNHPLAPYSFVSKNGACVWWYIDTGAFTPANQTGFEFAAYCANTTEFAKIGGRLQTIVSATDPLKSLQTLPNRIAGMSKLKCGGQALFWPCATDNPALAAVVAEMNAVRDK